MQNKDFTYRILMGEFFLSCEGLKRYLHLGEEIRLFEGEEISRDVLNKKFMLFVKLGNIASIIKRPDNSSFRFLSIGKNTSFFANYILPYTTYSQGFILKALENSVLVAYERDCILKILKEDCSLASEFIDFSANYHTVMQKRILLTANLSSSRRVITWLFALCEAQNKLQSEYLIPCELNQKEISDILILHISTCNKIFAWLEKQKIAKKTKDEIFINFSLLKKCIVEDWKIY